MCDAAARAASQQQAQAAGRPYGTLQYRTQLDYPGVRTASAGNCRLMMAAAASATRASSSVAVPTSRALFLRSSDRDAAHAHQAWLTRLPLDVVFLPL